MSRIKRVTTAVTTVSVGSAVVAAQQGTAWLTQHQANLPPWGPPAAALIIFFMASQALRIGLELALERITTLRRVLLGDQFVEGVWCDLMFNESKLVAIGYSVIKYSDGMFHIGGEDYPLDESGKGTFRSQLVEFNWPILEYTYTYTTQDSDYQGFGSAQFIERFGPSVKYSGKFVNRADGKRFTYEGFRLTNKTLLREFELSTIKKQVVQTFLKNAILEH